MYLSSFQLTGLPVIEAQKKLFRKKGHLYIIKNIKFMEF